MAAGVSVCVEEDMRYKKLKTDHGRAPLTRWQYNPHYHARTSTCSFLPSQQSLVTHSWNNNHIPSFGTSPQVLMTIPPIPYEAK